jgi:DNA-directed RNA polymerase specialized sigma24 family protein
MTLQNLELVYGGLGASDDGSDQLDALRRGDPAAVGAVYDHHHAVVRAFARRLFGDASVAEDLVHDVFLRLPKAPEAFVAIVLRTFLIPIAANRARHFCARGSSAACRAPAARGRAEAGQRRP